MTGSGNDFVFFDEREETGAAGAGGDTEAPAHVRAVCARGTGVGADGLVVLARPSQPDRADVRIRYYNADGSVATLCGNATLCTVSLAAELGFAKDGDGSVRIEVGDRVVNGRLANGVPEFELGDVERIDPSPPVDLATGERRIGYAVAGVPHFVVWVDDIEMVDLVMRGRSLRHHPNAGPPGANVNFVAQGRGDGFSIRTYERGVEGETLACGTGAVASAALLAAWGVATGAGPTRLWTRSGAPLDIRLAASAGAQPRVSATLRGEGRVVFRGELA